MSEYFSYDIFLSHSSKNKAVVRKVAARLKADGVRVWFDEWEIRAGDSIPVRIEEGLERSRVLALFMSAEAFGSDWATLEAGTFRFRDPRSVESGTAVSAGTARRCSSAGIFGAVLVCRLAARARRV